MKMKFPKVRINKRVFQKLGEAAKVVVIVAEEIAKRIGDTTGK
jgi:hypothetical protein